MDPIRFQLNGRPIVVEDIPPTTTVLQYVRSTGATGTKEGCAEGDCGACSVVVLDHDAGGQPRYRAINSCLLFLPMVHGKQVFTVEGLTQDGEPHPVQSALVDRLGSQCGYCTPGVVMSMFEACYRDDLDQDWKVDDQMCGNLCRCTGYRPIREATHAIAGQQPDDSFSAALAATAPSSMALHYEAAGHRYQCPDSWSELWDAMDRAPEARFIVGATDLALTVTKRFQPLTDLISLEALPGMDGIERNESSWTFGAAVKLSDLEAATEQDLPPIARMLRFFASRQIKNRATVGGNLCNASPIGDMAPILMALGATLPLRSRDGTRSVPMDSFFLDYRETAMGPGEVLAMVEVPLPDPAARIGAYKVSKRRELDISAVCAGCFVLLDEGGLVSTIRLAYGGMAATTSRAQATEAALLGQPWTEDSIEAAIPHLDADFVPIDDHRGSAWYRGTVAKNLLRGFFWETQGEPVVGLSDRPSGTVVLREGP